VSSLMGEGENLLYLRV